MNSILQATPLYYMSVINLPLIVLKEMAKILSIFFGMTMKEIVNCTGWAGAKYAFQRRKEDRGSDHWLKLQRVFLVNSGGDSGKMIHFGATYWLAKYCKHSHPADASLLSKSSHVWKRMMEIKPLTENYIQWLIGQDNISATRDKWLQVPPLHPVCGYSGKRPLHWWLPQCSFNYHSFWLGWIWWNNEPKYQIVPWESTNIWFLATSGKFTIASAWETLRSRGIPSTLYNWSWSKFIPQKYLFSYGKFSMELSLQMLLLEPRAFP